MHIHAIRNTQIIFYLHTERSRKLLQFRKHWTYYGYALCYEKHWKVLEIFPIHNVSRTF